MEITTGWRMGGICNITLQYDPAFFISGIRFWDGGKKRFRVWMFGGEEKLIRLRQLDYFTHIHHRNTVTDILNHRQIVSDKQICQIILGLQLTQQIEYLCLNRHVQCGDRFICDNKTRL